MTEAVPSDLRGVSFSEDDGNLFQVADPRLRADAIRHSILPRLHAVMRRAVALVNEVYGLDALEDSRISWYPKFRTERGKELDIFYENAFVGLGGKVVKGKWKGVKRKDGKESQLLPFRYGFNVDSRGLFFDLHMHWLKGLSDDSHRKYFDIILENKEVIFILAFRADMKPRIQFGGDVQFIANFKDYYDVMYLSKDYGHDFESNVTQFPAVADILEDLCWRYMIFFPVYDALLRVSMGEPHRFDAHIDALNTWIDAWNAREDEREAQADDAATLKDGQGDDSEQRRQAAEAAEKRVGVVPSLRWRVFQRDGWKCLACGRGSKHGAILHLDHVVPRSKGGPDEFANLQTLCQTCNLGKSNRDQTDLRGRPE